MKWSPLAGGNFEQSEPAFAATGLTPAIAVLLQSLADISPAASDDLEPAVLDTLFSCGLLTMTVPSGYGGLGADNLAFTTSIIELGRMGAQYAITAVPHLCNGVQSISRFAGTTLQREVLPMIGQRRRLVSFALTEDHTGSDVASLRSRLTRRGDQFVLNGSKLWITNVDLAGHLVVVARCPELTPNPAGTVFVLLAPDAPGLSVSRYWHKLTANGARTVSLYFNDIAVPADRLFGEPGRAIEHFNSLVDCARLGTAAAAVGIARRAWESILADHRSDRVAWNWLDADYRLAVLDAVLAVSAFYSDTGYADHAVTTALCKSFCTRRALELVQDIAYGYSALRLTLPGPVGQALQELPLFKVLEGPNEVICFHAMLTLLTRFVEAAEDPPLGIVPPTDDPPAAACASLLRRYRRLLRQLRALPELIHEQQRLLEAAEAGQHLHALTCVLLCRDRRQPPAADLAGRYRRYAARSVAETAVAYARAVAAINTPVTSQADALFARLRDVIADSGRTLLSPFNWL